MRAPGRQPSRVRELQAGHTAESVGHQRCGSSTIQGFATDISVNVGETVHFKIKTPARSYRLDIYRMGYYQGLRRTTDHGKPESIATLPANATGVRRTGSTGLIDCGNWAVSASWAVPSTAVSGIYFAKLTRTDGTTGTSHIVFVVRNDASHSDLLFQTSDTTWQAYNDWGGNSLYVGSPAGRAYKVSYNRPFNTRSNSTEDFVFNSEYPMVRFLEANGYDVSYFSRRRHATATGRLIKNHKIFLSVGHDEYWSGRQRANVTAARDAGVNLAFFSGNEIVLEDPLGDQHRLPLTPPTGPWSATRKPRPTRSSIRPTRPPGPAPGATHGSARPPTADGRRTRSPGRSSWSTGRAPMRSGCLPRDGKLRFWRNTAEASLAPGAVAQLPGRARSATSGTKISTTVSVLPGTIDMSTTTLDVSPDLLIDYGSTYGSGTATHHLTLYRAASGALVFGAGTVQWPWGLDATHDRSGPAADTDMRQATVNLLADMGAQPATLQTGLTVATASTDSTPPTSSITAPAAGSSVQAGGAGDHQWYGQRHRGRDGRRGRGLDRRRPNLAPGVRAGQLVLHLGARGRGNGNDQEPRHRRQREHRDPRPGTNRHGRCAVVPLHDLVDTAPYPGRRATPTHRRSRSA